MIRRNKNNKKNNYLIGMDNPTSLKSGIILITALLMSGMSTSAYAAITNSATAEGTYDKGTSDTADDVKETSNADEATVPVVAVDRDLLVSVLGTPIFDIAGDFADDEDTITFRYTVKNTGNVIESVSMTGSKPTFKDVGDTVHTGTGDSVSLSTVNTTVSESTGTATALKPGEVAVFDLTYTLDVLDAFRAAGVTNGVTHTATATSTAITADPNETDPTVPVANATIAAYTGLTLQKLAYRGNSILNSTTLLDATSTGVNEGDIITYQYIVTNSGNVPLVNVSVTDEHEGSTGAPAYKQLTSTEINNEALSADNDDVLGNTLLSDTSATGDDDGIIELLGGGAEVILSYEHVVTPEEILEQ